MRLIALLVCLNTYLVAGQSIWTNAITDPNPSASNPFTAGQTFDANITVSGIGRGAGITAVAAVDRYAASSWNTAAIDMTAYFEFTLTPNAGCEIDFTSFVYVGQASGTGPTSFAFRSSIDGYTANIGAPTATGTTIDLSGATYQNITTSVTFRLYGWAASGGGGTFSVNSFTFNGTVTCSACSGPVAEPTAETTSDTVDAITCTSAQLSWTASVDADNVIVVVSTGAISDVPADGTNYTANSVFGSGEELVAADAQYVVYNGSGTSVTVSGLTPGTTYNYAIFGYDGVVTDCEENYLTGGVFGSFTTLTGCVTTSPQITSIMVNSCNGSNEGTDELIVFENGSDPINVDDMVIDLPNSTWCNSGCGGNTIVNNSTYVNDLNAMAGCALFVYADPIPAGATVIIFTGDPPSTVLDYSSQCGAPGAPFYVLFLNNTSLTGNFANTGTSLKDINITFGPGVSDSVTYLPDDVDNVDGGTVAFDDAGNPSYFVSDGCVYPLALRLLSFQAATSGEAIILEWLCGKTGTGEFEVQRSADGIHFEKAGAVMANSDQPKLNYSFTDKTPFEGLCYYRLVFHQQEQQDIVSIIISVLRPDGDVIFTNGQLLFGFDDHSTKSRQVRIYSMHGGLVLVSSASDGTVIDFPYSGLFIIEIEGVNNRRKIVCL